MQEKINLLEEGIHDDMKHLEASKDEDARIGHKTSDTSFFEYKTHIAMTEERIITVAVITSGEKTDEKELDKLVEKSRHVGMDVENVIGDKAYSSKQNIESSKRNNYKLILKLNSIITKIGGINRHPRRMQLLKKKEDFKQWGNKNDSVKFYMEYDKISMYAIVEKYVEKN